MFFLLRLAPGAKLAETVPPGSDRYFFTLTGEARVSDGKLRIFRSFDGAMARARALVVRRALEYLLQGQIVAEGYAFLVESIYRISDLELASRLSFFLWSSIPDEELLALAERQIEAVLMALLPVCPGVTFGRCAPCSKSATPACRGE